MENKPTLQAKLKIEQLVAKLEDPPTIDI